MSDIINLTLSALINKIKNKELSLKKLQKHILQELKNRKI